MNTSTRNTSAPASTSAQKRSVLRAVGVCALVAIGANLALWGIGRAAGAGFVVDPALGDPDLEIGGLKVIVTTSLPFAVGASVLALAARRSRRWVTGVGVVGAAVAVASAAGPLEGGHDAMTGVLLATMHLTTGAAFLMAATRFEVRERTSGAEHMCDPVGASRLVTRDGFPVSRPGTPGR